MNHLEIFLIKRFDSGHTCSLSDRVLNNMIVTTDFVSEFTTPKLINHKRTQTLADIIEEIKVV